MQKRLGDVLIERGIVSAEQILEAVERQTANGSQLGEVLVKMRLATDEQIVSSLAELQDVPLWDLDTNPPTMEAIRSLNPQFCIEHQVLPVQAEGRVLVLAMRHSGDLGLIDEVRKLTGHWVRAVQATDKQLSETIEACYGKKEENSVEAFVTQALDEFASLSPEASVVITSEEETRPVIGLVNQVISDALKLRASDIHLEPREKSFELRYRVDGRLIKVREIPLSLMPMVVARIKIMADMDVADHRLPQDGRIGAQIGKKRIDLRVSVFPCHYGSRIVFRVLDRSSALKKLEELGFNEHNIVLFRDLIEKPFGIVLVTGPTGSGKTTTLYAALNEIRDEATNILTCEDPVEYELPGISQSQVHERIGLTFAAQLRSILRQDPDVVLVGEIRDQETAEIAIRAALTGHLVLSTLHCNDGPSAIPRLMDMGVLPYMVGTSLIGVVAQRLLRVLCPLCKVEGKPSERDESIMRSFGQRLDSVWRPVGCLECNGTGYRGRMAVHEILPVSDEMGRAITAKSSVETLRKMGAEQGYLPMQYDAWQRIEQGLTTFEEARRLIFFNTLTPASTEPKKLKKAS